MSPILDLSLAAMSLSVAAFMVKKDKTYCLFSSVSNSTLAGRSSNLSVRGMKVGLA